MRDFWFAQIFGILGALAMMISSWQKNRKKIFAFLFFDNLFYFTQYIILGAYAGAITNVVGFVRTLVFSKKNENKFMSSKYSLIIIILLYVIINFFTYDGIPSLFPAIASIIYAFVLWQDKPKDIRKGTIVMLCMWCIYNIFVKAYVAGLVEFTLLVSTIFAAYKIDYKSKKEINNARE